MHNNIYKLTNNKNSKNSKHSKNNTNSKYIRLHIIIFIIIVCLILYYLYKYLYNNTIQNNNIDNFILPAINTTSIDNITIDNKTIDNSETPSNSVSLESSDYNTLSTNTTIPLTEILEADTIDNDNANATPYITSYNVLGRNSENNKIPTQITTQTTTQIPTQSTTQSTTQTTTILTQTPINTPQQRIPSEKTFCKGDNNLVNYCIAIDACCNDTNKTMNNCYCDHPFVKNCKDKYIQCVKEQNAQNAQNNPNTNTTPNNCNDILKECCVKYNFIDTDNNKFNKPILQEQNNKILCALNYSKNIGTNCMDLCQTRDDCKAYSLSKTLTGDNMACALYSAIEPSPHNIGNKITTEYYIKK